MGVPKIGAVLALSGEQQYTRAIKAVNTAQRELRSEMKLVTDDFSGQANTVTALTKKYEILEKQRDTQKEKIDVYTKAVEESKKKEELATESLEKAEKQYKDAEEQLEKLKNSTTATTEEIEKQEQAVASAKEKLEVANRAYQDAENSNSKWQTSLNNAELELREVERELEKTDAYLEEAKESTDETAKSIDEFGKEVEKAEKEVNVFGGVLKANIASELLINGVKKLGTAITDIAKTSLSYGKNFEDAMSTVAATMGVANNAVEDTTGSYEILEKAARKAGEETRYSATESAEALNYLALAGYDAEKAAAVLPDVLNVAAAGAMDLAYASDIVTDSMASLEIESDRLTDFTNQMAVTAQKSNTNISQLGEAILQIGGTAKMLKGGTVELNTELGILADNGIKGAEGGTMLRNVLKNLTSPTDKASAAMKEYGINVYDTEGNMRPLNETLSDLSKALSGLSDQERADVMNKIFDSRTLKGAEALIANCGERFDELSAYISNADGAAQKMAETMSNNLAGEMKILESTAESTGITLYSKFEGSFKRITQSATKELGTLNSKLQSGDLGKSMDKLATEFESASEAAIKLGSIALPTVIDGLGFIMENGGEIVSALSGIGAGMAAFKAATEIEKAVDKLRSYKAATEQASYAQAALNLVTKANPYVLLATAIAGVGAALVTYTIVSNQAKTEAQKLNDEIKESIKSNKEFNNNISENISSLKERRTAQETNAATIKRLAAELTALNDKERLTTEEQVRMKSVVAQLNQLMPELNLSIDEQSGFLNQTNQEVENLVENYTELAKAQYYQEELTEIVKKQCEAEDELSNLMEKREEAVAALAIAENELTEYLKEQNLTREELNQKISEGSAEGLDYVYAINVSQEAMALLDQQISETEVTLSDLGNQYDDTAGRIGDHSQIDETKDALNSMAEGSAGTAETLAEQAAGITESFTSMGESIKEVLSEEMDILSKYEKESSVSGQEILKNMEDNVNAMQDWGDNLTELAGRADEDGLLISQGLLSHLVDLGPEGAAYVEAFAQMTNEELARANELWSESLTLPETIATKFEETGMQMAAGLEKGIAENAPTVEKAMAEAVDGIIEIGNKTAEIKSPSKRTTQTSKYLMEGFSKGIKDNQKTVVSDMQQMASAVLKNAETELASEKGKIIGQQFSAGLAAGIRAGKSDVINAATEVAQAAIATSKSTMKINSPSKVSEEMGENWIEGWIGGIRAKVENLKDAARNALTESLMPNTQEVTNAGISGAVAFAGAGSSSVGNINVYFQPQQMTDNELDRAFDYINERFGMSL